MTNIELYINGQLCDIQNPENLGIRLNRVLINPSELNTKDAQYSYSITLPSSPENDRIFGYANVEEVKNKFNVNYLAILIANGVTIFDGYFRMSEVSPSYYKGNLVLPAAKTVKDIFGERKMNKPAEKAEWKVDFKDFVSSVNSKNMETDIPDCIFPFVLYGLLPKVLEKGAAMVDKNLWDESVRFGITDFPPSINCMKTIKQIFKSNGYTIDGNVFKDERLANLYMSYQNPTEYEQDWNWGHLGAFSVSGDWTNRMIQDSIAYEKFSYRNDNVESWGQFTVNLFGCSMLKNLKINDNGTNIIYRTSTEDLKKKGSKAERQQVHITIPRSGLYKIQLSAELELLMSDGRTTDGETGVQYISMENPASGTAKRNNFSNSRFEIKLLRDYGTGEFDLTSQRTDADYYVNNLPQEKDKSDTYFFPYPSNQCVHMIDPSQNAKLLCGFRWGDLGQSTKAGELKNTNITLHSPVAHNLTGSNAKFARILSIKNGWSWNKTYTQNNKIYSAISAPRGYYRLRKVTEELEMEDGEEEIVFFDQKYCQSETDKYKIDLIGTPEGWGENNVVHDVDSEGKVGTKGSGQLSQIVWLEKGEHLTLVGVSDVAHDKQHSGWQQHKINFDLRVEPFLKKNDFIKVDNDGDGVAEMLWSADSDFTKENLNLFNFLPSEVKVDEWVDGFCKAFNLQLTQTGKTSFELNARQTIQQSANSILDISDRASVLHRVNLPLELPAVFELGFKINEEEQGYSNKKDNGGGKFETGTIDGKTISQTSGFSHNWFTSIIKKDGDKETEVVCPVITNKEVWSPDKADYEEMMKKSYTNYSQRFWYRSDELYDLGLVWSYAGFVNQNNDKEQRLLVPCLSESYMGAYKDMILNYKNAPDTILKSFFNVIATNNSNYTEVECFITPEEYEHLDGSTLIKFNSDIYFVASVDSYDPLGKERTRLKLIRKV